MLSLYSLVAASVGAAVRTLVTSVPASCRLTARQMPDIPAPMIATLSARFGVRSAQLWPAESKMCGFISFCYPQLDFYPQPKASTLSPSS
jgi:hypothetical protein